MKLICENEEFWASLKHIIEFLKPISICTTFLEGDMTPSSSIYGCFAFLKLHCTSLNYDYFGEKLKNYLLDKLDERYHLIDHPTLALSFFLDPMFIPLRDSINSRSMSHL